MATVAPQADIAETASVFGIATEQKLLLVRHWGKESVKVAKKRVLRQKMRKKRVEKGSKNDQKKLKMTKNDQK